MDKSTQLEQGSLSALLRLQTWMSAAFPIGAYTCSHGIETAINDDRINDAQSCYQWINSIALYGSAWNDSVLLHQAHQLVFAKHSDGLSQPTAASCFKQLVELNELALALQSGAERHLETTTLAASFLEAARIEPSDDELNLNLLGKALAFPVILGVLGAQHKIPIQWLLAAALQSTTSNLVWIATRLVPLGQSQSLDIIARLEPTCALIATKAQSSTLDDLGGCALLADLASLQHETLNSRVCRT